MAEGEKAFNEAKSTFDNPLAEPESAPQIAAEPQPAVAEAEAPSSGRQRAAAEAGTGRRTVASLHRKRSPPRPRPPASPLLLPVIRGG